MKINSQYLILVLFFAIIKSYSQDYKNVDELVKNYPKSFESTSVLASKISNDFKTESEKARAVFCWIAFNVEYDVKSFLNPQPNSGFSYSSESEKIEKLKKIEDQIIYRSFRRKIAVCEGYSVLYTHLAKLVGLNSEVIKGASKTVLTDIGIKRIVENHAWNAVQIDGTWRLVDVTWGAGFYDYTTQKFNQDFNPVYFDLPSNNFFMNHFPTSGTWNKETLDKNLYLKLPLVYEKFLKEKYEILEPKSGIIEASPNQKISFKIKNLSKSSLIQYQNNRGDIVKIESVKEENNILEFTIDYLKKDGKFITIYVDGKSTIGFKIVPKM
jgi:transglutaminase/protease-like cytokinesis protein 3